MTIWEKAVINMHKGIEKINAVAAVFSERMKAEISIVRLRIRVDDVQARIDEQYRTIGRKVVDLSSRDELPKTGGQLLEDAVIAAAMTEIVARKKDIEDLKNEIKSEQDTFKPVPKQREDTDV
jgi:hypothetical protein